MKNEYGFSKGKLNLEICLEMCYTAVTSGEQSWVNIYIPTLFHWMFNNQGRAECQQSCLHLLDRIAKVFYYSQFYASSSFVSVFKSPVECKFLACYSCWSSIRIVSFTRFLEQNLKLYWVINCFYSFLNQCYKTLMFCRPLTDVGEVWRCCPGTLR